MSTCEPVRFDRCKSNPSVRIPRPSNSGRNLVLDFPVPQAFSRALRLPKALTAITQVSERFDLSVDGEYEVKQVDILKNCWTTLVCGLLFHSLTTATDRVELRDNILKHFDQLACKPIPNLARTVIPVALRERAEKALNYQVQVGSQTT